MSNITRHQRPVRGGQNRQRNAVCCNLPQLRFSGYLTLDDIRQSKPRTMIKALTATVLALALLSGCVSTGASGHYLGTAQRKTAYVVSDRELDDYTIHNAITAELQKRGFRVIDSRDHAPASASNALVVYYLDHWNFDLIWLPVMYLSSLNIRIIDGNSSEVLATARFNAAMNTFPRSQTVVANLFTQLDQQNQPLVAAAN